MTKEDVALLLVLVLALALYLWAFDFFPVGAYRDDAQYVVLARALAQGNGPGSAQAIQYQFQHSAGFPLLLAPVYAISAGNLQALKLLSLLFTLANVLLIARGWRSLGLPGPGLGLAVAALYALSPRVVRHASMVMSEPVFLFLVLMILILTLKSGGVRRFQAAMAVLLGGAWFLAVAVRAAGVAVVVPSIATLLLRRQLARLAVALASAVAILVLVVALIGLDWRDLAGIGEYRQQFDDPGYWQSAAIAPDLIPRVMQAVVEYAKVHLRNALLPLAGDAAVLAMLSGARLGFTPSLISLVLLLLVLTGYLAAVARRILGPATLFVTLYIIVILFWPWRGDRFLYPILPFLYAYLLLGGIVVVSTVVRLLRLQPQVMQTAGGICLALFLCAQVAATLRLENWPDHMYDLRSGTVWIRENSAPDALVLAEEQQAASVYSRRATLELSEVARLKSQPGRPAVYVLIAPRLVWGPSPRQLAYSDGARWMLGQFESGGLDGTLAFEDQSNMVRVYQLRN